MVCVLQIVSNLQYSGNLVHKSGYHPQNDGLRIESVAQQFFAVEYEIATKLIPLQQQR